MPSIIVIENCGENMRTGVPSNGRGSAPGASMAAALPGFRPTSASPSTAVMAAVSARRTNTENIASPNEFEGVRNRLDLINQNRSTQHFEVRTFEGKRILTRIPCTLRPLPSSPSCSTLRWRDMLAAWRGRLSGHGLVGTESNWYRLGGGRSPPLVTGDVGTSWYPGSDPKAR